MKSKEDPELKNLPLPSLAIGTIFEKLGEGHEDDEIEDEDDDERRTFLRFNLENKARKRLDLERFSIGVLDPLT